VDGGHLAHQHACVALSAEQVPYRPGDLRGRQAGGRDLVKQRLEQMMVLPVDQRDVHGGARQSPGDGQSAESGADNDHPRPHRLTP
jgi:hypothetical protein